jgi:hypothetical protein
MEEAGFAKLLCDGGWAENKFRWCARASAIGAEQAFAPLRGCTKKIAVVLFVDSAEDLLVALASWPGGKPTRVLVNYDKMAQCIGREAAEQILRASQTTCRSEMCVFKDKTIPFSEEWSETLIVPFAGEDKPGPHFVKWASQHRIVVMMAKCDKGTLVDDIGIFFNSFSADAEAVFPHFVLRTAEATALLNDLFCIFGEEDSGEWGAHIPPGVAAPPAAHAAALHPPMPKKKAVEQVVVPKENPFMKLSKFAAMASNKRMATSALPQAH